MHNVEVETEEFMGGVSALQMLLAIAGVVLVVVTALKVRRIARMPLHLRWDLYPIPHEKGKGVYGGSYYEEIDWWTKPSEFSMVDELKATFKEAILIQSLFHHNRSLWSFSFPFHLGLYSLIGFGVFLIGGAILELAGVAISAGVGNVIGPIVYYVTPILGAVGFILGAIGALGLFLSRLGKAVLRDSSVTADYFNLLLLFAVFVSGIYAWAIADPSFATLRSFTAAMIGFQAALAIPTPLSILLVLTAVFFLYMPFTHMTHVVGKYFTYHKVRWQDEPNIKGSKIEKAVADALGYKIEWSASHIKSGSTWAEAATSSEEDNKNEQK
jgi:nitrate reductase gamma subunit